MEKRTIKERKSILRFIAPLTTSENMVERYSSSTPQINDTTPPSNASKIRNANRNLIFLFIDIFFGVRIPISRSPSVATASFKIGISGKNTVITATNAPIRAEIIKRFDDVGIFENTAAKYNDRTSTVKLIKK